jgi:hypothetical protein
LENRMSNNVFAKAQAGAWLSPGQRAFLKVVDGWVAAGAFSALLFVFQLLGTGSINWAQDWRPIVGAFLVATALAAKKYFTAQGDTQMANVAGQAAAGAAQWAGVNDVGNKPATPYPNGVPVVVTQSDGLVAGGIQPAPTFTPSDTHIAAGLASAPWRPADALPTTAEAGAAMQAALTTVTPVVTTQTVTSAPGSMGTFTPTILPGSTTATP